MDFQKGRMPVVLYRAKPKSITRELISHFAAEKNLRISSEEDGFGKY